MGKMLKAETLVRHKRIIDRYEELLKMEGIKATEYRKSYYYRQIAYEQGYVPEHVGKVVQRYLKKGCLS